MVGGQPTIKKNTHLYTCIHIHIYIYLSTCYLPAGGPHADAPVRRPGGELRAGGVKGQALHLGVYMYECMYVCIYMYMYMYLYMYDVYVYGLFCLGGCRGVGGVRIGVGSCKARHCTFCVCCEWNVSIFGKRGRHSIHRPIPTTPTTLHPLSLSPASGAPPTLARGRVRTAPSAQTLAAAAAAAAA